MKIAGVDKSKRMVYSEFRLIEFRVIFMAKGIRIEKKERTRAALLRAAVDLFSRDGFAEARTSDIAGKAKVSHGSVFAHFPTREDLLAAAIKEVGARITRRLHELVEGGIGVEGVLRAHLEGIMEFELFYTRLVTQGKVLPAEARNAMIGIQSAISFHVSRAAEREMAEGRIRRMPMHFLFNTWLGLVHYYLANGELFAPGASVLKRHGPEILAHYLALIGR